MEQTPRIVDVVTSLIEHGRVSESVEFLVNVVIIAEEYNVDNLEVLKLTVDEYLEALYPKQLPIIKGRWDRVIYGEAIFK